MHAVGMILTACVVATIARSSAAHSCHGFQRSTVSRETASNSKFEAPEYNRLVREDSMLAYAHGEAEITRVISGTREANTCAEKCASEDGCFTFAFSFIERRCILMSDAQLFACDPEDSESASCSHKSRTLLDQISRVARCRLCEFYQQA